MWCHRQCVALRDLRRLWSSRFCGDRVLWSALLRRSWMSCGLAQYVHVRSKLNQHHLSLSQKKHGLAEAWSITKGDTHALEFTGFKMSHYYRLGHSDL